MRRFSNSEVLAELKSELGFRYAVYGRKVNDGSMSPAEKDRKIGLMQDAISEFEGLVEREKNQLDIFGGQT